MRQNVGGQSYSDAVMEVPLVTHQHDAATNENSKSWTVPANEQWRINALQVNYTSTATVGDRLLRITLVEPDGAYSLQLDNNITQAASLTYRYDFFQGTYPMPTGLAVPARWTVTIADANNVDVNDDMKVLFLYERMVV